jgi:hypothetical protein
MASSASIDVSKQLVIKCGLPFAWEYLSEPLNIPDWNENILTAKWKTTKPLVQGTRIEFTARIAGRPVTYTMEVERLEPEAELVMKSLDGPLPLTTTYRLSLLFEGTVRVSVRNEMTPGGAFKLISGVIRGALDTAMEKDLGTLKSILERRAKEKAW